MLKAVFSVFIIIFIKEINSFNVSERNNFSVECPIFCSGSILHQVQINRLYNDSKNFVDMEMKFQEPVIQLNFENLMNKSKNKPGNKNLKKFVNDNFKVSNLTQKWVPTDWIPNPSIISKIYDKDLRAWVVDLNTKWKSLGRRISSSYAEVKNQTSLLYAPNPFIVPGGRFKEIYYWDSYWIIEGLLLSDMVETAKGMLDNFLFLVSELGYVPNGLRKYYLGRSQPPLLIPMFDLYWKESNDLAYLNKSIGLLEKEFNFWLTNRTSEIIVDDIKYSVFQYKVNASEPRPESYFEDVELVKGLKPDEKNNVFSEIKSATESGWDFSSRWFSKNDKTNKDLKNTKTRSIIPVCLNSLMCYNSLIMSRFYEYLENKEKSEHYRKIADELNKTISRVFWSEDKGIWFDYDLEAKSLSNDFYLSNLVPLWCESYGIEKERSYVIKQVMNYLKSNKLLSYPGGVPVSLIKSDQQWDLPYNWPPLQYFLVMGLHKAGSFCDEAKSYALDLANQWVLNVFEVYKSKNHLMFEKYNAVIPGKEGSGGEYVVQDGFGWTNSIVIKFLSIYGHNIRTSHTTDYPVFVIVLFLVLSCLLTLIAYNIKTCKFGLTKPSGFSRLENCN